MPNGLYVLKKIDQATSILKLVEDGVEMAAVMGHLGRDPETRFTANGLAICKGSVAVSWGKRGDPDQKTEWCNFTAWREEAEIMASCHKGDAVLLMGKLGADTWTKKDGEKQTTGNLTVWNIALPLWKKRNSSVVPQTPRSPQVDLPEDDIPF